MKLSPLATTLISFLVILANLSSLVRSTTVSPVCYQFVLLDSESDGWKDDSYNNVGTKLNIKNMETGTIINIGGSFSSGGKWTTSKCLESGSCYKIQVFGGDYHEEHAFRVLSFDKEKTYISANYGDRSRK